jgi:hypothetical protein
MGSNFPVNSVRIHFGCRNVVFRLSAAALFALVFGGCTRSDAGLHAGKPGNGDPASASAPAAPAGEQIPAGKHPLAPAWKLARDVEAHIEKDVHDYSAVLCSRERFPENKERYVDRKVLLKIRHRPFSAYFRVIEPKSNQGEEAIYIEGKNNGKALVHTTGITGWVLGTLSLDPRGSRLMKDQHYPMTEVGILNLSRRLKEQAAKDMRYEDCEVTFSEDARIDDRPCTCVTVVHPRRRKEFLFYKAKVYVDKQWKVPLCYEAYDWPADPAGEPPLIERYEYRDLKINPGLTDLDFDVKNPAYGY